MTCSGITGIFFELVVIAGLVLGIATNVTVISSCDMIVTLRGGGGSIGPWRESLSTFGQSCQGWTLATSNFDWLINMGHVTSMMALVFGCCFLFWGVFHQYLRPLPCTRLILPLCGTGTTLSLALVWPMYRTDLCNTVACTWGTMSTTLLISQLAYLIATLFTRCMREPRYIRNQQQQNESSETPSSQPEAELPTVQQQGDDKI